MKYDLGTLAAEWAAAWWEGYRVGYDSGVRGMPSQLAATPSANAARLGSEYGRLLAERDRLIAAGVDPSDLETPERPL